jgi:ribose 5-phosphate isomerase B
MDYPDIAATVGRQVLATPEALGILVCGSGIGVAIAANKLRGIRAAHCHDPISARLSRQHNDANVLTLGERLVTPLLAEEIVRAWLAAAFEGGRHQQRVDKMAALESER